MALKDRFQKLAAGEAKLRFDPLANDEARFANLRLSQVEPDRDQPRRDLGDLGELKESIKVHGILQPIIVTPLERDGGEGDHYRIISGERRYTAARELGMDRVPAIVRTVEDAQRLELQIIENLHRKDLHPLEEAMSYKRLMDDFHLTQRQAADRVGKSVAYLNQCLRLLDLSDEAWEAADETGEISKSLLLEIVKHPKEDHVGLIRKAGEGQLTVREARDEKYKPKPAKPGEEVPKVKQPLPKKHKDDDEKRRVFKTRVGKVTVEPRGGDLSTVSIVEALTLALEKATKEWK